jgi:multiple sugar transport system permease protein
MNRFRLAFASIPWGLWVAIVALCLFALVPIAWQVLTSLKSSADIAKLPTVYWPRLTLVHYRELFARRPFGLYLLNSSIVAIASTLLCLLLATPAAYALARLRLPGEGWLVGAVAGVMLFPYILLFQGLLDLVRWLGLGNQYLALVVPYTAINLPLTLLVLRSFFQQLPIELEDAARLDGYGLGRMLVQILLPLCWPAIVTTGILAFIFSWNEFMFALTFMTRESMKTVPVASAQLGSASVFEVPYGPTAAAMVVATVPVVLLVLVFQRRIVEGLTSGAVKG